MGNQNAKGPRTERDPGITAFAAPLIFHTTHGENIRLSSDQRQSRRHESFCKGICFSSQPVSIHQRIFIRFAETSTSWSGVLRFGFTSVDPDTINGSELPRYACPDLTNRPGYWAKALGERYAEVGNVLHYHVTRSGDVMYGINGEDKGLFFGGVNVTGPLWVLLDIYGNSVAVDLAVPEIMPSVHPDIVPSLNSIPGRRHLPSETSSSAIESNTANESNPATPSRYHGNVSFAPVSFHLLTGKNIHLSANKTVAIRVSDEFCNGYVFTSRPIHCGETVVIQIQGIDRNFIGGLGFGLTSCDPSGLTAAFLPDDADMLLDRPEYWVVNKDICQNPEVGDELSFTLSRDGEVKYSRNNHRIATLMHVDKTLPLWAFFDVYGIVQKIRVLGVVSVAPPSRPQRPHPESLPPSQQHSVPDLSPYSPTQAVIRSVSSPCPVPDFMSAEPLSNLHEPCLIPQPVLLRTQSTERTVAAQSPTNMTNLSAEPHLTPTDGEECSVCYERPVNSVVYTCGHMCMCFTCAIVVKQNKGECPICRSPIQDIIKIFRT